MDVWMIVLVTLIVVAVIFGGNVLAAAPLHEKDRDRDVTGRL